MKGSSSLSSCRLPISLRFTSCLLLCPKLTDASDSGLGTRPLPFPKWRLHTQGPHTLPSQGTTHVRPSIPSMAPLPPLWSCVSSIALYPLNGILSLIWHSVPSTCLCPLFSPLSTLLPLSPLRPSVLSTALCLLYSHMSPLNPYVASTACSPLLRYSVPFTAICHLYGHLSPP